MPRRGGHLLPFTAPVYSLIRSPLDENQKAAIVWQTGRATDDASNPPLKEAHEKHTTSRTHILVHINTEGRGMSCHKIENLTQKKKGKTRTNKKKDTSKACL